MFRTLSYAFAAFIAASTLILAGAPASAQSWPTRSVRFVIPIGPGSGVDITARLLADKFTQKWGQPVVVENRPGGDGFVAIGSVLGANDDHVLLFSPASSFTAHPLLHDKLPYNPNELIPAARVTNTIIGFCVPASLGVNTLKEFVDKVRAEPGKLNYASATGANDLLFAAFLKTEKLDVSKVPYRDTVSAINDLAEGRVHAFVGAYAIMRPHIQAGKIKLIALTSTKPAPQLPDVQTAEQQGFNSLTMDGLTGFFGAKDLPQAARDRIAADVREALTDKTIVDRLTQTGQVINAGNAAELTADIDAQRALVKHIGDVLGLKAAQ